MHRYHGVLSILVFQVTNLDCQDTTVLPSLSSTTDGFSLFLTSGGMDILLRHSRDSIHWLQDVPDSSPHRQIALQRLHSPPWRPPHHLGLNLILLLLNLRIISCRFFSTSKLLADQQCLIPKYIITSGLATEASTFFIVGQLFHIWHGAWFLNFPAHPHLSGSSSCSPFFSSGTLGPECYPLPFHYCSSFRGLAPFPFLYFIYCILLLGFLYSRHLGVLALLLLSLALWCGTSIASIAVPWVFFSFLSFFFSSCYFVF